MPDQVNQRHPQHALRNAMQMMIAIDRQLEVAIKRLGSGEAQDCLDVLKGLKTAMPRGMDELSDHLEDKQ